MEKPLSERPALWGWMGVSVFFRKSVGRHNHSVEPIQQSSQEVGIHGLAEIKIDANRLGPPLIYRPGVIDEGDQKRLLRWRQLL